MKPSDEKGKSLHLRKKEHEQHHADNRAALKAIRDRQREAAKDRKK